MHLNMVVRTCARLPTRSPITGLASFIRENSEQILAEWDAFARSLTQGASMNVEALRDHAREMLDAIAREIETPRTPQLAAADAEGRKKSGADVSSAARGHGAGRANRGFSLSEIVAEFRALRVSVITLWMTRQREMDRIDLLEMSRFNEAIDQAIAESVTRYSSDLEHAKDRFIAILGHDLRSPLNATIMAADLLSEAGDLSEPHRDLVARIAASAKTMNSLVSDLLDFARIRFGVGIPIETGPVDLEAVIKEVVAEVTASQPESDVRVEVAGDLRGEWDSSRIAQAITNLVTNAVEHGSTNSSIHVEARGTPSEIAVSVHNHGLVIPAERLGRLFDAMAPTPDDEARGNDHLGLGLYIVHSIIVAHGGTVHVDSSSDEGTTFTLRLPRHSSRPSASRPSDRAKRRQRAPRSRESV
jgi:signal transduction histidine kinase